MKRHDRLYKCRDCPEGWGRFRMVQKMAPPKEKDREGAAPDVPDASQPKRERKVFFVWVRKFFCLNPACRNHGRGGYGHVA